MLLLALVLLLMSIVNLSMCSFGLTSVAESPKNFAKLRTIFQTTKFFLKFFFKFFFGGRLASAALPVRISICENPGLVFPAGPPSQKRVQS